MAQVNRFCSNADDSDDQFEEVRLVQQNDPESFQS